MPSPEAFWRKSILPVTATIGEAITCLEKTGVKIVLISDSVGVFEGTISDGDIRRGLLRGLSLGSNLESLVNRSALVVPRELTRDLVVSLMLMNKVQQIPIVDELHCLVGLHLWDEITTPPLRSNIMVIMAGGRGTRLHPLTETCPKPLLPVAGKPILEHIISRAKAEGFRRFVLTTNYLGEMIESYFSDGERLGVEIAYVREKTPLGTAGALGLLMPHPDLPFVVTNGDVLTDIRYGEFIDFHVRQASIATMAVRMHELKHPFGVVQTKGFDIVAFEEKPIIRSHINAGVYVLDPTALGPLVTNDPCDMPTLFERLQAAGHRTVAYPIHEPWLDVGRSEDLQIANTEATHLAENK